MSAGTEQTPRFSRRLPRPGTLLLLLHLFIAVYAGVAVFVPWWRTRQFKAEVESLSGNVRMSRPDWGSNRRLRRFAPLFERIVSVNASPAAVDDSFVIRAAAVGELEYLSVSGSGVSTTGVSALAGEQNLERISFVGTAIDDDAFDVLAKLPDLTSLHIVSGRVTFSDSAFKALGQSQYLRELTIGPASLSEGGAEHLAQAETLEHLRIIDGRADADAFRYLGRLTGLRTLWLGVELNPDANPLPQLRLLTRLERLSLHAPAIDDLAARDLCRFGELSVLNLPGASIGDETIRRLAETEYPRRSLVTLNLDGTQVTDFCLYDLAQFPHLRRVSVRSTEFGEPAAAELCRLHPRLKVQYTNSSGWPQEMTWQRVYDETGGMMEWPQEEN